MDLRKLQNTINAIRQELNEKIGKRDLLNMQIMRLEANLKGLKSLAKQEKLNAFREKLDVGITDAVRTAMRLAGTPLSAPQVKERLNNYGFDLHRFKNPSAVVHNTLQRMEKQGEIIPAANGKGYDLKEVDRS